MAAKQDKQPLNKQKPVKRARSKATDVAGLELAFRTTTETYEQLGARFGVSRARVCQLAKELGWRRGDMRDRVRVRAESKVEEVETKVQQGTEDAVEASAVLMANTIIRERRSVARLLTLADRLLGELEAPARGKTKQPLPVRIDSLRKLGDTMGRLVTLERSVLGITDSTPIDPTRRVEEAIESGMDKLRERFKAKGVQVAGQ